MKDIIGDDCFRILDSKEYILFYFGASWCGPCQQVLPHLDELSKKYDSNLIQFFKIDIDLEENKLICDKCEIKVVPAFLLFKDRKFINRIKGNNIPGVTQMINDILFPPPDFEVMGNTKKEIEKKDSKEIDPYEANRQIFNKKNLFQ